MGHHRLPSGLKRIPRAITVLIFLLLLVSLVLLLDHFTRCDHDGSNCLLCSTVSSFLIPVVAIVLLYVASLEDMVGHIYGRLSLLADSGRPHMFIRELMLYVDHLRHELQKASEELVDVTAGHLQNFKRNLINGIEYYRRLADQFRMEQGERFLRDLDTLLGEIEKLLPSTTAAIPPLEGIA